MFCIHRSSFKKTRLHEHIPQRGVQLIFKYFWGNSQHCCKVAFTKYFVQTSKVYTPPTTTLYLEGTTHTCNVQKKSLKFFLWKYLDLKNSWRNVYGSSNTNAIHGISEMFRHVLQKLSLQPFCLLVTCL